MGEFIKIIQSWVKDKKSDWRVREDFPTRSGLATFRHTALHGWVATIYEQDLLVRWAFPAYHYIDIHGQDPKFFVKFEKLMRIAEWAFFPCHRNVEGHPEIGEFLVKKPTC
jgi:hypothetical protein